MTWICNFLIIVYMDTTIVTSWKKCYDNQLVVENINDDRWIAIKINDNLYVDNVETSKNVTNKTTILVTNCRKINLLICNKINHIIIDNCSYINITSLAGIISGVDILNSKHINFVANCDIFYLSFGKVYNCNTYLCESVASNTLITTLHSNTINFILNSHKKFVTNTSIFNGFILFMFMINNTDKIELHYLSMYDNSRGSILYKDL